MDANTAELIDIDFLWYLIDQCFEDHRQDGDLITFCHPRRGRLTALQSGKVAILFKGGFNDRRGLPATASILPLDMTTLVAPRPLPESSGVVVAFQAF